MDYQVGSLKFLFLFQLFKDFFVLTCHTPFHRLTLSHSLTKAFVILSHRRRRSTSFRSCPEAKPLTWQFSIII